MSVHEHKDGRWFCKYLEDGKEVRRYFGRGDISRHQALRLDESIKRERGKLHAPEVLTVSELLQRYHREHPVESSTAATDFYRLTSTLIPALGAIQAEALSTQALNNYVNQRLQDGRKRRTVAREISILKAAYNWGQSQDPPLILNNPLAHYTVPKSRDSEAPSPPTGHEVQAILKVAPDHLRRALLIIWYAGLRPGGEVTRIMWSDVNFEAGEIRVLSARKGGPTVRYVPLHQDLLQYLNTWRVDDTQALREASGRVEENLRDPSVMLSELPVVHYLLKPLGSLKRSWSTAKSKAGITRRVRLYDIRHAWFTNLLRTGQDLKAVSEVGGHSRADTTLRFYDHVTKERHREIVNNVQRLPLVTV